MVTAGMKIGILAGESSGDRFGAEIMTSIRSRLEFGKCKVDFIGLGGEMMKSAGLVTSASNPLFNLNAYSKVILSLPSLFRLRSKLVEQFVENQIGVFIGIDSPDFNLSLEAKLKEHGVRIVHFVSPSIWAWKPERIHRIKEIVDLMILLFPHEKLIYDSHQIANVYIGHPFCEKYRDLPSVSEAKIQLNIAEYDRVISLLPGSRPSEIEYMSPILIDTAEILNNLIPSCVFLVAVNNEDNFIHFAQHLDKTISNQSLSPSTKIKIIRGNLEAALISSDAVIATSGTVTLEAALALKPMIITYKVSKLNSMIIRAKYQLPYFGLPNILADKFLVPEFIQEEATAQNLARALIQQLNNPRYLRFVLKNFIELKSSLDVPNGLELAVDKIIEYVT